MIERKDMNESNIFGVSARAIIAFTLVVTVCIISILQHDIKEPLYTLVVMAVSFYLGKSSNNPTGPGPGAGATTTLTNQKVD